MMNARYCIAEEETLDRAELMSLQRTRLGRLLEVVLDSNSFYKKKLQGIRFNAATDPLGKLPLTQRAELEQDQQEHPLYGSNLTFPLQRYCRFHQTSGSSGRPLRWLDTAESWNWIKRCWGIIYAGMGVTPEDRFLFPFSFGPFLGFWAAFDSAVSQGSLCLPAGGLSTSARLRMILDNQITIIGCTPTYALRMAEVAAEEGIDISRSAVRALVVAGEPGGNIPSTRKKIEQAFNARVFDHTGMTEIGSLGFECQHKPGGVHLIESECIAEVIDPKTLELVDEGECGELVITNLGRIGSPVIRYRTGDQVRVTRGRCTCGRSYARLEGGILGRVDDMFIVRGNNVFPSALESVIRRFPEIAEFRIAVRQDSTLTKVEIDIEPTAAGLRHADLPQHVTRAIQESFSFRPAVRIVAPGTLPRFEMKARRFSRANAVPANA